MYTLRRGLQGKPEISNAEYNALSVNDQLDYIQMDYSGTPDPDDELPDACPEFTDALIEGITNRYYDEGDDE